jgi:hypothetical protein
MRTVYQKLKASRRPQRLPRADAGVQDCPPTPMPLPQTAAVRCNRCRSEATFHTSVSEWKHPMDVASATSWRHRVAIEPQDDRSSLVWFFPHIVAPGTLNPAQYLSLYRSYSRGDVGVLECTTCGTQKAHVLDWPRQAFYRVQVGRVCLWAVNRGDLIDLREYIASTNRREMYRSGAAHYATRYLPRPVIVAKNRPRVVAAIDALLAQS